MRVFALLMLLGCPSADPVPADPFPPLTSDSSLNYWTAAGPMGVGVTTSTFVDESRATPEHGDEAALPERTLTTEIWYPAEAGGAEQALRDQPPLAGPHPVLIWGHGFMSDRLDHTGLGRFLASQGYVVASIGFPSSGRGTTGGADHADVVNQPEDVSFVIDSLLVIDGLLAGAVDGDFVAVAGLSLGGLTTALVGLHPAVADPRIDAIVPVAPATCSLGVEIFDAPNPPMLIIHGDGDAVLAFEEQAVPLFERSSGPRWLARLVGGTHTGFPDLTAELFDGLEHADSVGCGTIEGAIDGEEGPTVDPIDGEGDVLDSDCTPACLDLEGYGVGMRPTRQVELLKGLMHAFLDAETGADPDARLWIEAGIGLQEEDVEIRVGG